MVLVAIIHRLHWRHRFQWWLIDTDSWPCYTSFRIVGRRAGPARFTSRMINCASSCKVTSRATSAWHQSRVMHSDVICDVSDDVTHWSAVSMTPLASCWRELMRSRLCLADCAHVDLRSQTHLSRASMIHCFTLMHPYVLRLAVWRIVEERRYYSISIRLSSVDLVPHLTCRRPG